MNENVWSLILLGGGLLAFLLVVSFLSKNYSLNNFKSKTVGAGQHGTARWATPKEIHTTYHVVPFRPRRWRKGEDLPTEQGLVLGSVGGRNHKSERGFLLKTSRKLLEKLRRPVEGKRKTKKKSKALSKVKKMIEEQRDIRALVDSDDVHCLMIGASGVGKTAFFLYPNLEYACACGMSYLALDTKGDLARNYGCIASKYYGYFESRDYMEIANETLPKSIEAKEFSALFCRDRHASGTHIVFEWMFRKKRSTGSNKRSGYHPKSVCIGRGTILNSLCE